MTLREHMTMESHDPAPRHTQALIEALRAALAEMPEIYRKSALKHASEAMWAELIEQSEDAKQAAREAPPELGAKATRATEVLRQDWKG